MRIICLSILPAALLVTGCGRPPPAGGPPGEYSVNAIVAAVSEEAVQSTVQVAGSLRARDAVEVVSEINAPIAEIIFTEGEPVAAGQILVKLDDAKLKARVAEAKARFQLARTNLQRAQELLDSQTISRQEHDQMQAEFSVAEAVLNLLEQELQDTNITAPFDGITGARLVSPGQYLAAGTPVTWVVQMDPLEVEFRLPERHAGLARRDQQVEMSTASHPDRKITGKIFFIAPMVDEETRTVMAKALIPNPDNSLKPGMFGPVNVVLEERPGALVVPESCIRHQGERAFVVIVNPESKAEFRNVTVGIRMPGRVEIIEGLKAGERVVVEGFQKMGPGTTVIISPGSEKYGVTPDAPPAT